MPMPHVKGMTMLRYSLFLFCRHLLSPFLTFSTPSSPPLCSIPVAGVAPAPVLAVQARLGALPPGRPLLHGLDASSRRRVGDDAAPAAGDESMEALEEAEQEAHRGGFGTGGHCFMALVGNGGDGRRCSGWRFVRGGGVG